MASMIPKPEIHAYGPLAPNGITQKSPKTKLVSATHAKMAEADVNAAIKQQIAMAVEFWGKYGVRCDPLGRPIKATPQPVTQVPVNQQVESDEVESDEDKVPYVRPEDFEIPSLNCPITMTAMLDPVATRCGHLFDRVSLERAIQGSKLCPTCRAEVRMDQVIQVFSLGNARSEIVEVQEKCARSNEKSQEVIQRTKTKLSLRELTLDEKLEEDKKERAAAAKAWSAEQVANAQERAAFHTWVANMVPNSINTFDRIDQHLDTAYRAGKQIEGMERNLRGVNLGDLAWSFLFPAHLENVVHKDVRKINANDFITENHTLRLKVIPGHIDQFKRALQNFEDDKSKTRGY